MITLQHQSDHRENSGLIDLIKANLTLIKPDLDWSLVQFEECTDGKIVRLTSQDPSLQQWLQQTVTITRPDPNREGVAFYNAFYDSQTQLADLLTHPAS